MNHDDLDDDREMSGSYGSLPLVHGMNVMLGGAMLSGIILVVFVMCYCCHKNARKQEIHLPAHWRDSGLPLRVYTIPEPTECFDWLPDIPDDIEATPTTPMPTPSPPPSYEAVASSITSRSSVADKRVVDGDDDAGLPTYEAALRMEAEGHV